MPICNKCPKAQNIILSLVVVVMLIGAIAWLYITYRLANAAEDTAVPLAPEITLTPYSRSFNP